MSNKLNKLTVSGDSETQGPARNLGAKAGRASSSSGDRSLVNVGNQASRKVLATGAGVTTVRKGTVECAAGVVAGSSHDNRYVDAVKKAVADFAAFDDDLKDAVGQMQLLIDALEEKFICNKDSAKESRRIAKVSIDCCRNVLSTYETRNSKRRALDRLLEEGSIVSSAAAVERLPEQKASAVGGSTSRAVVTVEFGTQTEEIPSGVTGNAQRDEKCGHDNAPSAGRSVAVVSPEHGENEKNPDCDQWTHVVKRNRRAKATSPKEAPVINDKREKPRRVNLQPKRKRAAVAVHLNEGRSYADVLRKVRNTPNLGDHINAIRRTRGGAILVQLDRGAEALAAEIESKLKQSLADSASVRKLEELVDIEIREMDELASNDEIYEAIRKVTGSVNTSIRIKVVRRGFGGMKSAIVSMPRLCAEQIIKMGRLRIGYVSCRVRLTPKVIRCYKCHRLGHVARACAAPSSVCRKCGESGHSLQDCANDPKCILCVDNGRSEVRHITGSIKCPIFRNLTRNRNENPPNKS